MSRCSLLSLLSLLILVALEARADFVTDDPTYQPVAFAEPADGLRVLWWNIFNGTLDPAALDANFQALLDTDAPPDMIVLGEYHLDHKLPTASETAIARLFPHRKYFHYSSTLRQKGILVLSRLPIEDESYVEDALDWANPRRTAEERRRYRERFLKHNYSEAVQWLRSYMRITVTKEGETYHVVPIHTAMPWVVMQSMCGIAGSCTVGLEILNGTHNPLMFQLERFKTVFDGDVGAREGAKLIIGDFNMPKALLVPWYSAPYRLLARSFVDSFSVAPKQRSLVGRWCARIIEGLLPQNATFPTNHGRLADAQNNKPPMQLDHAFTANARIDQASVLPLAGSDHYPIVVDIH